MYSNLPLPPKNVDASGVLQRMIQGLGYRYYLSTFQFSESDFNFDPGHGSMTMKALLKHTYQLITWTSKGLGLEANQKVNFNEHQNLITETLKAMHDLEKHIERMDTSTLEEKKIYLKRTDTNYPFWYLINGPIADALTHVGQINSWRRMAGNPVGRTSPFTGEAY